MSRRVGIAVVPFLLAVAVPVIVGQSLAVAIVLAVVAVVWGLWLVPPVADRLPHVEVRRGFGDEGPTLQWVRARGGRRRRLRRASQELVSDIHAWLAGQPIPWAGTTGSRLEVMQAMAAAETEAARSEIWQAESDRMSEEYMRAGQAIAAEFGGRVGYVLEQYVQLGLMTAREQRRLMWLMNSRHWLQRLATEIDKLARRL